MTRPSDKVAAADPDATQIVNAVHQAIANPAEEFDPLDEAGQHRTLPQDRPALIANGDIEYRQQVDASWDAILAQNYRPATSDFNLYRKDRKLVTTEPDDEDRLTIYPIEEPHMRDILSRHIFWYSVTRDHGIRAQQPNYNIVRDLPRAPHRDIPRLRRISVTPYLAADSDQLTTENGYYHQERILMDCPFPIILMDLPEAIAAFDDIIADFPFETAADRANCFAAAIMPILSVRAPVTPLALFGKPAPRTGATLLAEVLSIVANGFMPTKMQLSADRDESAKEIASGLQNNNGILLWDNLAGRVDNPVWAQYLTGENFGKRKLGHDDQHYQLSRMGIVDFATANNLSLSSELVKRSFSIRLNARMSEPGERSNFRHPHLIKHVRQHRPKILSALCSIVHHWIEAGCPEHRGPDVMGGFETWRITTASILHHAGINAFLGNAAVFIDQAEQRDEQWMHFLNIWWQTHQDQPVTATELFSICEPEDGKPILPLKGRTAAGRARSLSKKISDGHDVVRKLENGDEVTISRMPKERNYTIWRLSPITYVNGEKS